MDHDHQERIKQRAHEIWESEGRPEGRDADHWSQAEQELNSQTGEGDQTGGGDQSSGVQPAGGQESGSGSGRAGKSTRKNQSQPGAAEAMAGKTPKKTRKSAKTAASASTPYLNDGP
jgi:phosphotransferase system  glucose/maltose/N-acetylglucosamine-specific IIC component